MNFSKDEFIPYKVYISWLGSVYIESKKEDFLKAIKSIEWQDCEYAQEIVIVKDGILNKDLESFLKNYSFKFNHKIITLKNNSGLGIAMKIGSQNCNGKYIARFDTDDINLPNRLSTQIPLLEKNRELALISSAVFEKSPNNQIFYKNPYKQNLREVIYKFNPINHPTVILNKNILIKAGNYENIKYFEDYYLWLKILKKGYEILLINDPLVIMNTDAQYRKRWGVKYFKYEFIFIFKTIQNKLIKKKYIFFSFLRLITRVIMIPAFQEIIRKKRRKISNLKYPEIL